MTNVTRRNICFSSALIFLRIQLVDIDDFFSLLDRHFEQLRNSTVDIRKEKKITLLKSENSFKIELKYMFIPIEHTIEEFSWVPIEQILQMNELEELHLFFSAFGNQRIIDEIHLNTELLCYLSKLNKFLFNILSHQTPNGVFPFVPFGGKHHDVAHYVDYYDRCMILSRIYSFPTKFQELVVMGDRYPDGPFFNIRTFRLRQVWIPLEHKDFLRLAVHLPRLEHLSIRIRGPQKLNFVRPKSIINFSCLTHLSISFEYLERVTENFTRSAARRHCRSIITLRIYKLSTVQNEKFYRYFPSL